MMELPLTQDEIATLIRANTQKVFSTMLGLPITASAARGGRPLAGAPDRSVISFVGLTGQWSGSGSIQCSANLACTISGKLLLADFDSVNSEVLDAIGEMANMILGNFKNDAESRLGPLRLSTPTVVHGSSFEARNWNGQYRTSVSFDCEGELFEVKVCLARSQALRETLQPAGAVAEP